MCRGNAASSGSHVSHQNIRRNTLHTMATVRINQKNIMKQLNPSVVIGETLSNHEA